MVSQTEHGRLFKESAAVCVCVLACVCVCARVQASEMLLFNKKLTALQAYQLGLVTEVFPDTSFQSEVWSRLQAYAKLPPNVRHTHTISQTHLHRFPHLTCTGKWHSLSLSCSVSPSLCPSSWFGRWRRSSFTTSMMQKWSDWWNAGPLTSASTLSWASFRPGLNCEGERKIRQISFSTFSFFFLIFFFGAFWSPV